MTQSNRDAPVRGTSFDIDFVCQSSMGRSEGGMETWAYQFLPGLLRVYPDARLHFYGALPQGRPDPAEDLRAAVGEHAGRFDATFFPTVPGKVPQIVRMTRSFLATKRRDARVPAVTITAGTFLELAMALRPRRSRRSVKIAWLRTIWVDQKTYRIPAFARPVIRRLEAAILRRADLLLANGSDIAARYAERGLDVKVIRNAVDLEAWRMPPPALGDPIRVGYVGRLGPEKGIGEFIALADRIAASAHRDRFRLEVYGHLGEEKLVAAAAERGVVAWHGAVSRDRMPGIMAALDVCVALTRSDPARGGGGGTSNAMLEQLAAGRVMLAWDNVIFRQWLDANNAYLVPQGDVAALHDALLQIGNDRDEARRRAANGPGTVADYGVEAMMTRFRDMAADVVRKGRAQATAIHP